jgi:hypothetical protein
MKTPETKPSPQLEVLRHQAGTDATLERMLKMNRPLTVETYVRMSWPGKAMRELSAEERASIPEGLAKDPLPSAPVREEFATQEEFDEARGGWQSRVGRIKGLAGVKKTAA